MHPIAGFGSCGARSCISMRSQRSSSPQPDLGHLAAKSLGQVSGRSSSGHRQRGASLVEAVVAAALMGLGVVGGLTAWDTASISAGKAVRIAWARCVVRGELQAILAAPFDDQGRYAVPPAFAADNTVTVTVSRVRGSGDGDTDAPGDEQQVTVTAFDPQSTSSALAQSTALKTRALDGRTGIVAAQGDVTGGCPAR